MRLKPVLLAAAAIGAATAWDGSGQTPVVRRLLAAEPSATKRDTTWVDKRIEQWQPTRAERAFDEIGWATDIREAERLAMRHNRPIFLFTYDGANLAGYRC